MARDITEGRASRAIAVDIGIVSSSATWQNTDIAFDIALGGLPFVYAISDNRPCVRQTAPFKKEQFDNSSEPGEQSLTGWLLRSQMSFHTGSGINFFDPATTDDNGHYRFADSKGVDVWTKGQVTLLKNVDAGHITTGDLRSNGRSFQSLRSIEWNGTKGVLLHDGYDVDKIDATGTETHFINYNAGTDSPVYAVCDDGTTAYWVTNNASSGKLEILKKALTLDYTTSGTSMLTSPGITVTNSVMEFIKERIVVCINNSIYEMSSSATTLPSPIYTHPASTHIYTSIAASGAAIYVSGYNGIQSTIQKFTINTSTGALPTLTSAIVAAELPVGEIVHRIYYYLGKMMIGTNKGVRVADISEVDGSIAYGPLIVETSQPCYDFAARDHYVWCATGVDGEPGVIRIDLGAELETLRFAWANDVYYSGATGRYTTACSFIDGTEQLAFTSQGLTKGTLITNKVLTSNVATLTTSTAHGLAVGDSVWIEGVDATFNSTTGTYTLTAVTTYTLSYAKTAGNVASTAVSSSSAKVKSPGVIYVESATDLAPSGYLTTGNIRFNMLEPKNFKRLLGRGDFTYGSMTLYSIAANGDVYDHISYDSILGAPEVTTSQPELAQEYLAYKFQLYRDGDDATLGPIFKGYQAKATIATPRQELIKFSVYCLDVETDRYNVEFGYTGKALTRFLALKNAERGGDIVTFQDLTTGESYQVSIEQVTLSRTTPPDRGASNFGGILDIIVRTV